jgi:hypothetical protein
MSNIPWNEDEDVKSIMLTVVFLLGVAGLFLLWLLG